MDEVCESHLLLMQAKHLSKMDLEWLSLRGRNTLSLCSNFLTGKLHRLTKLTVTHAEFKSNKLLEHFVGALSEVMNLRELELDNLSIAYTQSNRLLNTHCLLEFLKTNRSLKSVALRHLGIGEDRYDTELLSAILLYNETLQSLDLSSNRISKLTPLMQQLIRNRCSNLLELNLARNEIEAEEMASMLKKLSLERESAFGNLHFKLRLLNLAHNPATQMEAKVARLLEAFYGERHQKLFICVDRY